MKTNWKAKLKIVLENKQKPALPSKAALTEADNTISLKKDSSAFVSDNLITFPANYETGRETTNEKSLPQSKEDVVSSASVSGHLTHSSEKFQSMAKTKSDELHKAVNRIIDSGITFDVATNDFSIIDDYKRLTDSDDAFFKSNYPSVLCELQQSLLTKHLFNKSPERLEDFTFEVLERESILTEADEMTFEIYCDAVMQTTKKWFDELLREI